MEISSTFGVRENKEKATVTTGETFQPSADWVGENRAWGGRNGPCWLAYEYEYHPWNHVPKKVMYLRPEELSLDLFPS